MTLRQAGAGANALVTGQALVALYDWTFLLGQSLMPAVNALLLGSLLYQSRLVPRVLPVLGFIGAALLVASAMRHAVRRHGIRYPRCRGSSHSRSRCGSSRWAST